VYSMSGYEDGDSIDAPRTIRVTDQMIFDTLLADEDDGSDDEDDLEYYLDAEDIDEEMGDDDDDYEDYEDDDDDDEDTAHPFFTVDPTTGEEIDEDDDMEEDEEDEEDETGGDADEALALQQITALLNSAQSAEARTALLARLLGGHADGGGGGLGRGFLSRLNLGRATSGPERARLEAERRRKERWWKPQLEPHPIGAELLASGEFGKVRHWAGVGKGRRATRRCLTRQRHWDWTPPMSQVCVYIRASRYYVNLC
jgi:hypothetical protein